MARLLEAIDGGDHGDLCPRGIGIWEGAPNLCPITTGAALSDTISGDQPDQIALGATLQPALLMPFLAERYTVEIACGNTSVFCRYDDSANPALKEARADQVMITLGPKSNPQPGPVQRCEIDSDTYARLTEFAHRTYAPGNRSQPFGRGRGGADRQ